MKNRVEINSKNSDGESVVLYVVRPSRENLAEAQLIAGETIARGLAKPHVLTRDNLLNHMINKGMWSQDKQKQVETVDKEIYNDLVKLKRGGLKLTEARDLALSIRAKRTLKIILESDRRKLDEYTVEAIAENARFDYLVSVCCVNDEGNKVFKDVDDYKSKATEPYAYEAASSLASLINDYDEDWQKKLPENQFLLKHKLVGEDLRLIDKNGKYITADGREIDENYNYTTDENGVSIDSDGLPVVESQPFLDDDGNPIT